MEDNMSNYELETILKMILTILEKCETLDEAKNAIKKLLNR